MLLCTCNTLKTPILVTWYFLANNADIIFIWFLFVWYSLMSLVWHSNNDIITSLNPNPHIQCITSLQAIFENVSWICCDYLPTYLLIASFFQPSLHSKSIKISPPIIFFKRHFCSFGFSKFPQSLFLWL